ncbi:MAG TPA: 16S rRNA (guanine(527)-N(7))-methyltransferase RsmG [Nocardioidaceae bacterium]|nr:16S rRNA (guanine(527)-N(7))-methyltransferase RsmG [Nocardioidaceae bacterium]
MARGVFGDSLDAAVRYAGLLADAGVVRGVIGPRETDRLWERHLLNCAVLADGIPAGDTVVDIGSGAGLPGLVLALRRPDLTVTLVEPLQRRVDFLVEALSELDLAGVEVVRARAEDLHGVRSFASVVSRAVAPLPRLLRWCLPLVAPGGQMLAMKGASAEQELDGAQGTLRRLKAGRAGVVRFGEDVLDPPTTAIRVAASVRRG